MKNTSIIRNRRIYILLRIFITILFIIPFSTKVCCAHGGQQDVPLKIIKAFFKGGVGNYNLSTVLRLESIYFDFDLEKADSIANSIVDSAYKSVVNFPVSKKEEVLTFCETLNEAVDKVFYPTNHEFLYKSLNEYIDDPQLRIPGNCIRYVSMYNSVYERYVKKHPAIRTKMSVIRVGNGREAHVLLRFDMASGERVYWDPSLRRKRNYNELCERFEISPQAISNNLYFKPLSPRQNLHNELIHYAAKLKDEGNYDTALKLLELILEHDSFNFNALYSKATWLRENGDLNSSVKVTNFIFRLDSTSAKAAYNLGKIDHKRGNYDSAIKWYNKAVEWSDSYISPEYWKAIALLDQGKTYKAKEIGLKFLKKDAYRYSPYGKDILKRVDKYSKRD